MEEQKPELPDMLFGYPITYTDDVDLLSDLELEAHEKLIRAAIRWTEPSKVTSALDLLMAELRRLRGRP